MVFNSLGFFFFLVIVFIAYWLLQNKGIKYQNALLLIVSYIFYGWWDYRFLALIGISTGIDYVAGIKMYQAKDRKEKRWYLFISLSANLGLLGFFKYFNFFISSLNSALLSLDIVIDTWSLNVILPIGISFYTFQTLSYSLDIYRGEIKPTEDFIGFATFVSFFPQLVAGPIERASHLLPQFLHVRRFSADQAIHGVTLIMYGLFKKIVIADRLAIYVNNVFGNIEGANTISLCIGIVFFSFQIYCDFSGYSLIARGVSKLLGFELMINFRRPYLASSLPEFWRRWHISLSTWFRDYVYIPLGGNKVSVIKHYFNLMVVFLLSGLWHGANWTFVVWGGLHGVLQILYLSFAKTFKYRQRKSHSIIVKGGKIGLVYFFVCFAWVFFRAENLQAASHYLAKIAQLDFSINLVQLSAGIGPFNLFLSFLAIGGLFLTYLLPEKMMFKKTSYHIAFNIIAILLIITIGVNGDTTFIYFQF